MKDIELNPDGTFPRKYKNVDYGYTTTTSTYTADPNFIPDPPKEKNWRKELKDTALYFWVMWWLAWGTGYLIYYEIIKGIIWLVRLF